MSKKITLTVDIQTEMSNLQSQVNKMQQMLGGLKLGDNLKAGTDKVINDLLDRIKKVKDYTEGNSLDLVDEKKVNAEFKAIQKDFKSLVDKLNANGKNIKLGDTRAYDAIKNAVEKYQQEINKASEGLRAQKEEVSKIVKKYKELKEVANQKSILKEAAEQEVQKIKDEIDAAKKAYVESKSKDEKAQKWINNSEKVDQYFGMKDEAIALNKKLADAEKEVINAEKQLKNAEDKVADARIINKKKAEDMVPVLKKLKQGIQEVSSTQLQELKNELTKLQNEGKIKFDFDPQQITSVEELDKILKGMDEQSIKEVAEVLQQVGVIGKESAQGVERTSNAFEQCTAQAKAFDSTLENFKRKAAYFFGIENAINLLKRAVRSAYNTIKDLDEVMTQTAVVTSYDVGDMWDQLPEYTRRANELGVSIHDAYEAATLYYQQGLKTNEVMAVSNETLKMARIAGLDAATATDRMTNALRGFNMTIDESNAQRVNDVYSKLAAITASNTNEISTAMTKTASLAHSANMEFETTAAFLAQMIETTRESAETAGTALKTVIARFSEVKKLYSEGELMGTDEEGEEIDVNKVSTALRSAGINMNEYLTGAKGLDDIFIELASKWDSLDMIQQRYIATMAAGSRQQSRFIAMMSDYKRTVELVNAANNSAGASQKQFNKTLDSLKSKLAKLKNSWDTFLMGIADNELVKGVVDLLTQLIDGVNSLLKGLDGIPGSLARIGVAVGGLKIGKEISTQFLGQLLKMKNDATKIADGTGKSFIQGFSSYFAKFRKLPSDTPLLKGLEEVSKGGKGSRKATSILAQLNTLNLSNIEKENLLRQQNINLDDKLVVSMDKLNAETAEGAKLTKLQAFAAAHAGGSMIKLGLAIGASTVALTLLIKFLKYAIDEWGWFKTAGEKANDELKKLEENADNAAKAADNATESYNGLKNSLTSLEEKYKSLEDLTRGTQEWRDAVVEVNNEVLKLTDKYKDLEIISENGVLKVTNADEARAKQYEYMINAQSARLGADRQVADARVAAAKGKVQDAYAKAKYGAGLGDMVFQSSPGDSAYKEIVAYFGQDFETLNKQLKEATKEWQESIKEAEKTIEQYNASLAALAVSNAELTKNTENETSSYMNANRMDSYYIAAFNAIAEEGLSIAQVKEKIAIESGYSGYGAYEKENGAISDDAAQSMLAEIRAVNKATAAAEKFSKELYKLPDGIKKMYSRSDLAGLSKQDMKTLLGDREKEYNEADKEGQTRIIKEIAKSFASDQWKNLTKSEQDAYRTKEAYQNDIVVDWLNSFANSTDGYNQAVEKMAKITTANSEFQQKFLEETFKKLSGGVANDLADNFAKVFETGGAAGIKQIQQEISNITKGWSEDRVENFVKTINSVDWRNLDSVESLQDLVNELGFVDADVTNLTKNIINFAQATKKINFEQWVEQLTKAYSLIASAQSGDLKEWTAEQAQLAVNTDNVDWSDFIYDPLTDKYTLIGKDLDEIISLLKGKTETDKKTLEESVAKGMAGQKELGRYNGATREGQMSFLYAMNAQGYIHDDKINYLNGATDEEVKAYYQSFISDYIETLKANTAELQRLNDSELMAMDPHELASMGTDRSEQILDYKAGQVGMSQELISRNTSEDKANLYDIFKEAQSLGIDTTDFESHMKTLKKAAEEAGEATSDVLSAQVALANNKKTKGMKDLSSTFDDWSKLLDKDGKLMMQLDSDSQKVADSMKKSVKEMLNFSEDLPDSFFQSKENIDLLIATINDEAPDAFLKLKTAAADSILEPELRLDTSEARDEIQDVYNYIEGLDPELAINSKMDIVPIENAFNALLRSSKMTAEQIQAWFSSLGIEFEVEYETSKVETPYYSYEVQIPKIKAKDARWGGGKPIDYTPPKSSGGGGGSGSGKEEKPDYWENPFDELYNLQEKINEALRTREALERKYQKLLKQTASNLSEVTKAYYDQITHLREEANLQQQMQEGRARQLNNIGNEIYTDSEGNRATFASLGVMKYASYDQNTGVITIDWPALEEIASDPSRTAEGEAAEAYIKRLEELSQQFEEVRDKLWDIEDQIETLQQEAIDSYLTFEDRVMEALKNQYQQEIDDFKALSDTIKNATDEIIDGIQDDVELARQIRDNTKKEEDIAEKEARLAYLRRDTSGANDLEIKKLEKELEQEREDYSDTLVDQQIAQMQKDAEDAAEQRERQIELMQHSLDMAIENGELWEEVYGLIATSVDPQTGVVVDESPLMDLLRSQEAFGSLSKIGQEKWWEDTVAAIKEALVGLGVAEDHYNIGDEDRRTGTSISTFMDRLYEQILGRNADEAGKEYWSELIQSGKMSRADVIKSFLGSEEFRNRNLGNEDFIETLYQSFFGRAADKEGKEYWVNQLKTGARSRDDIINEFFNSLEWTNSLLPRKSEEQGPTMGAKKPTGTSYSSGALPELVLDAKDTENFIALRDVLANLLGTEGAAAMKTNGGDTYFDINIDAEIGSDYDVDKLAEQIEKKIYNLGSYRNANVIRGLR